MRSQRILRDEGRALSNELDELTVRRAARGDDDACSALVELYQERVFALISRSLIGFDSAVEDIAQETFLSVFRSLAGFRSDGAARLSTWILTIASRRLVDFLRKPRPPAGSIEPDRLVSPNRSDEQLRRRELADTIRAALLELPPAFRTAFVLREYHGFDYRQIGEAVGVDSGTVKSRLSRARKQLRDQLEGIRDE